jgi:uncharacterized protein (TIRG00374 family)
LFIKYKRKIIYSLVFGALVYLGLSIYANFGDLLIAFGQYGWWTYPLVLLLSACNYVTRFFKWEYYIKVLDIELERKMSFVVFMSSFIMSITPGKIGEVFKSYLLKEQKGTPISKSAPIVLAERITDFLSLVVLSLVCSVIFGYQKGLIITIGVVFVLLVLAISSKKVSYKVIGFFERFGFFSKISHRVHTAYDSIYQMVRFRGLMVTLFYSIVAWFFECTGFFIVVNSFGVENLMHIDIFVSTFIYGFATIAGAVTMLPGGLGATDASIAFLLVSMKNVSQNIAVAATLLIRVATLWFAVVVGIISTLYYQKITHKKVSEIALDS